MHRSRQIQTSRGADNDHPIPYDPNGPPGQTGDRNIAPLGRANHPAKTHLNYRVRQRRLDLHDWTTPHGLHRRVDRTGTHETDPPALIADQLDAALRRIADDNGITLP